MESGFFFPFLVLPFERENHSSGSDDKASVCNAEDPGSIPGLLMSLSNVLWFFSYKSSYFLLGLFVNILCVAIVCGIFHWLLLENMRTAGFLGEGNSNPLQYSCLENPTDRGAWWATIHGVAKSRTRLSDFCVYVCVGFLCINFASVA